MAKVLNVGYKRFRENVNEKKIVLWGAGRLAPYYIQTFCEKLNIIFIVDGNEKICGKDLIVDGSSYRVISEKEFISRLNKEKELLREISIFITPTAYAGEILKHIDEISLLDRKSVV